MTPNNTQEKREQHNKGSQRSTVQHWRLSLVKVAKKVNKLLWEYSGAYTVYAAFIKNGT